MWRLATSNVRGHVNVRRRRRQSAGSDPVARRSRSAWRARADRVLRRFGMDVRRCLRARGVSARRRRFGCGSGGGGVAAAAAWLRRWRRGCGGSGVAAAAAVAREPSPPQRANTSAASRRRSSHSAAPALSSAKQARMRRMSRRVVRGLEHPIGSVNDQLTLTDPIDR